MNPMTDMTEMEPTKPTKPAGASGYNLVEIGDETFPDSQEGDEVSFSGKGVVQVRPDGTRCVAMTEVEGVPVAEAPAPEMNEEQKDEAAEDKLKSAIVSNYGSRTVEDEDEMG